MDQVPYGMDFSPEFLAKYEIIRMLGEGGMGQVFLGVQRSLGRQVAIKFLSSRVLMSEKRVSRFHEEAKLCADMRHPNIVELYECGGGTSAKDRPYMVFELIDGESLADRCKRVGRIPLKEALDMAVQMAEGLIYAHEKGIVHRDIKSDNILLSKDGRVKVGDFGIAVVNQKEPEEPSAEASNKDKFIPGTPAYMSPEQAKGEEATAVSDLYSFGVILYEMLTGRVPFTGETSMAVIIQHISNEPKPICEQNPDVPPQLEEVVLKALQKEPAKRFQSAQEFLMKLKKAKTFCHRWSTTSSLKLEGGVPRQPSSAHLSRSISMVQPESAEDRLKRRVLYAGGAAAGLLALILPLWWLLGPRPPQVTSVRVQVGFTEAVVTWQATLPSAGAVKFRPETGGAERAEAVAERAREHTVRLNGLAEDMGYVFRVELADGVPSREGSFRTTSVAFKDVTQAPVVDGVEVRWSTSFPVQSEVRYLARGEVKSRQRSPQAVTSHRFRVDVNEGVKDHEIELVAIVEGDFRKTQVLKEFRIIDSQVVRTLTEAVGRLEHDAKAEFNLAACRRFDDAQLKRAVQEFQAFGADFWSSASVGARDKWHLYGKLFGMREADAWCRFQGHAYQTGVDRVLGRDFREGASAPPREWTCLTVAGTPAPVETPVAENAKPVDLKFHLALPDKRTYLRGVLAVRHGGFPGVAYLDVVAPKGPRLSMFGKPGPDGFVPAGTLYHGCDPRVFAGKGLDLSLTVLPMSGVDDAMLAKVRGFSGIRAQILEVALYLAPPPNDAD